MLNLWLRCGRRLSITESLMLLEPVRSHIGVHFKCIELGDILHCRGRCAENPLHFFLLFFFFFLMNALIKGR